MDKRKRNLELGSPRILSQKRVKLRKHLFGSLKRHFEELHKQRLSRIPAFRIADGLEEIKERAGKLLIKKDRIVIGICGASSSGKTTIANYLKNSLENAIAIALDDYHRSKMIALKFQLYYDDPSTYDFRMLRSSINAFIRGKPFKKPVMDRASWQRVGFEEMDVKGKKILILDNPHVFNKKIADLLDLKVYIESSLSKQIRRALKRDHKLLNRPIKRVISRQLGTRGLSMYKYVLPQKLDADMIIIH